MVTNLNQRENIQFEGQNSIENLADKILNNIEKDEEKLKRLVSLVMNGVQSYYNQWWKNPELLANRASSVEQITTPTTAKWKEVAEENVAQVGETQYWTRLDKQGETWVDVA